MDTNTTHRPVTNDRVPSPAASSSPEEATGDSESDAEVSVEHRTTGHSSPSETDDDAESCSGRYCIVAGAADDESDDGTVDDDDVGTDEVVDMTEVDSKMALPWWRRGTVAQYAAKAADAGCRPAAAEGGKLAAEGGHAPSETNDRLFWEACIAHGY
jgi:hypothetical protein